MRPFAPDRVTGAAGAQGAGGTTDGAAAGTGAMKPAQTLREIYEERKDLYEKFAEYIIDVDKQSIEATAKELAKIARNG